MAAIKKVRLGGARLFRGVRKLFSRKTASAPAVKSAARKLDGRMSKAIDGAIGAGTGFLLGTIDGAVGGEAHLGPVPVSAAVGVLGLGLGIAATGTKYHYAEKLASVGTAGLAVWMYQVGKPAGAKVKKGTTGLFRKTAGDDRQLPANRRRRMAGELYGDGMAGDFAGFDRALLGAGSSARRGATHEYDLQSL